MIEPRGLTIAERGRRISDALNRLGPSYIKLGQFLATRPDIVGTEMADALSALKDDLPPFPTGEARAIVEASIGQPIDAVFESFSDSVAAASIAQVHKAVLRRPEGREVVAVKVLRPGIRRRFARDLRTFYAGARFVERNAPETRRLRPVAVVEILQRSVSLEMDLRLEAAAYSEMAENITSRVRFPPAGGQLGADRPRRARHRMGRGHAAPRPRGDRRRRARPESASPRRSCSRSCATRSATASSTPTCTRGISSSTATAGSSPSTSASWAASGRRSSASSPRSSTASSAATTSASPRCISRRATCRAVHSAEDFAQALRAIGEPIHGHRASEISMAKLLGLLFEVTEIFDMQTRPELVLLQKTMVVVEGVARRLDPEFDMWTTAEPVVREWIERNLGAGGPARAGGRARSARSSRFAGQAAGTRAARRTAQPRARRR